MEQKKRNILIIGGAGFIGSHLCFELVKQHNVICVDNFSTSTIENIAPLLENANFKFIKHDITEPLDLESYVELAPMKVPYVGIHEIYNLACPTSPKQYNAFPIDTLLANSHGTKNALDIAVKYKAKILHFSTSAVYGEPLEQGPFPETYWGYIDPLGPRSPYNEGKRFAETMVTQYRNAFGIDAKIVRIFNTYGPRMRLTDGRMIPDFISQALKNEPIGIYGTEKDISTFCYITDMIEGITRVMRSSEQGPINLGSSESLPVVDIARLVIKLAESSSDIVLEDPLPYSAKQGIPDITIAKERLGWFPVVSPEEGLTATIEYMRGSRSVSMDEVKL
ncbi:MAG: NAD-dependent epimerase/dehydratase family protein [Patescibacteria group bacterium]|jgi:UDP-glucuronate decarboxylase